MDFLFGGGVGDICYPHLDVGSGSLLFLYEVTDDLADPILLVVQENVPPLMPSFESVLGL